MTKAELRKIYLSKRSSLSSEERASKSRQIRDLFFKNVDLSSVNYLHCFIPIEKFNEIDTHLIFERLWSDHPRLKTVVPRVSSVTGELQSLSFNGETELSESSWDIREPIHQDLVDASEIDIVLVPLLCFDLSGHRVGYGKGYYDRFLALCRDDCRKVGLSYFPPVESIDDVNVHDMTLDLCVTSDEVYSFAKLI